MEPAGSTSQSACFEILGLPSEVASLILDHVVDGRVGMRLGLTEAKLLKWIDMQEQFWERQCESLLGEVKSFGRTVSAKQRCAMAASVLRNLADPSFEVASTLAVHSLFPKTTRATMQDGADFAVCSRGEFWDYRPVIRVRTVCLLDLSQWPEYKLVTTDVPTPFKSKRLEPLSRELLCPLLVTRDGRDESPVGNFTPLFNEQKAKSIVALPPCLRLAEGRIVSAVSSNANFQRVAFLSKTAEQSGVIAVYDASMQRWSPPFPLPNGCDNRHFSGPFSFSGDHIVLHMAKSLIVIKLCGDAMQPKLLYAGPNRKGSILLPFPAVTSEYLVLYYNTGGAGNLRSGNLDQAVVKIRLDQLEGRESLDTLFGDEALIPLPTLEYVGPEMSLTAYGHLCLLHFGGSVMLVDLHQNKPLRQFWCNSRMFQLRFVDSTMFVAEAPFDAVIVVDLLSRRPEPPRLIKLFFLNTQTEEMYEIDIKLKDLEHVLEQALLQPNYQLVATTELAAKVGSRIDEIFLVFRHPIDNLERKPTSAWSSFSETLHYRIQTHSKQICISTSESNVASCYGREIKPEVFQFGESDDKIRQCDVAYFNFEFDMSDLMGPRLLSPFWTHEEARSLIPAVLGERSRFIQSLEAKARHVTCI